METLSQLLAGYAETLRQQLASRATVSTEGSELTLVVTAKPHNPRACPFTLHLESDSELTITFGSFSICHIDSRDSVTVILDCRQFVGHFVSGQVTEQVWFRGGKPCRALAKVGPAGQDVHVHTRSGLCLSPSETDETSFEPY